MTMPAEAPVGQTRRRIVVIFLVALAVCAWMVCFRGWTPTEVRWVLWQSLAIGDHREKVDAWLLSMPFGDDDRYSYCWRGDYYQVAIPDANVDWSPQGQIYVYLYFDSQDNLTHCKVEPITKSNFLLVRGRTLKGQEPLMLIVDVE